jgi:hypothetical protein
MPYTAHRIGKRCGQGICSVPVPFEQVKSNALRRLLSDARHAPKAIDQTNEKW